MKWMLVTRLVPAALVVLLLCNLAPALALAQDAAGRRKAPSPAEQASVLKLIHELFGAQYAKTSPGDRVVLAARLMEAAADSGSDPNSQYVLLREARENAVAGGDLSIALAAIDALASRFEVDREVLLVETLGPLLRQSESPAVAVGIMDAAMAEIDTGAAADDFDPLTRLRGIAETAAARTRSAAAVKHTQARLIDLNQARMAFESAKIAKRELAKKPDDPEAHTIVGKYTALQKGDWPAALKDLSHCSDSALKTLAAADLAAQGSSDPKDALGRGDAWWHYAGDQSGFMKIRAEQRASDWYRQAADAITGLDKAAMDKRIQRTESDVEAYASSHGMTPLVDPTLTQDRRDAIEKTPTVPLDGQTLTGTVTVPRKVLPYLITGTIKIGDEGATITVPAGTEIRGGVLDLGGKGHLIAKGETGKPVVFRHVVFLQDLGGLLEADGAIFDDCTFKKGGAWFSNYSSKWVFSKCVLFNCRFGGLTEVDYGFQIQDCVLASMDFPEIQHPHKGAFDHVKLLHDKWNTISGCSFVDCIVPPTVCWCAQSSNFFGCKFVPGEAFESPSPWQETAYLSHTVGPSPQSVWADKGAKLGSVTLVEARSPFPIMSLAGMEKFIPELIPGSADLRVVRSHLK
jgi:hypothetical protein